MQGTLTDERALIGEARAGDEAAFAALFAAYHGPITAFLHRLVGHRETADDLAQDTFLKAYRAIGRTNPELNFRAWIYRIATNTALSYHRRQRLLRWLPFDADVSEPNEEFYPATQVGERELIERALGRIKPTHATLLLLRHQQGLSLEEVAGVLGVSANVAKARLFRARAAFMNAYEALEREPPGGR